MPTASRQKDCQSSFCRTCLLNQPRPRSKVTRPEIYFGELTDRHVYVNTKQNEFDYPQGDAQQIHDLSKARAGFDLVDALRRTLLAWAVGDLSKLPFSDDVTSESRVLIHRKISEIVNGVAPFLTYDQDPYVVVGGRWALVLDDRWLHGIIQLPVFKSSCTRG